MKKQYIEREFDTEGNLAAEFYWKDKKMTKLHREDGPAFTDLESDYDEYWLNGEVCDDKDDWEERLGLKKATKGCEGRVVVVDGVKYKLQAL